MLVCSGISVWASVESEIEALGDGDSSGDRSCGEGEWSGGDGDRSDRLFIKQLLLFKIRCQFEDVMKNKMGPNYKIWRIWYIFNY